MVKQLLFLLTAVISCIYSAPTIRQQKLDSHINKIDRYEK